MLGKTGSGKSCTANSILGRKAFDSKVGGSSVTQRCRRASGDIRGRHLLLLDTPGLLDTHQTPQDVQRELRRSVSLLYPGPHVFLLIVQIGRFTPEEKEAVRQFKLAMGAQALQFAVVVFTHGDFLQEGTSVKECLIDQCNELTELVDECGGRYCVFNNNSSKNKGQVLELLTLVDCMMQGNEGSYYTSKILQKVEEELDLELQEEKKMLAEKEELFKKQEEAVMKDWYERKLEDVLQKSRGEIEELKKKHELENQSEKRQARNLVESFKQEIEQHLKKEKEQKTMEMLRVMAIRQEEERKREALQENLDKVSKMLEEQVKQEDKIKRAMEEKIEKNRVESLMKERERELQQIQKEQAIRQREAVRREALQKELDKLTFSLKNQVEREEERTRKMAIELRHERDENQRIRDIQMEKLREEKRRTQALNQELNHIKMQIQKQKSVEESLAIHLEQNLQKERERCVQEILLLKKNFDKRCREVSVDTAKMDSAKKDSAVTVVTGYAQEMGLLLVNLALEKVRAPCSIQ